MLPFEKFNKIPRLSRDIIITEKIDGTNAQIFICSDIYLNEYSLNNSDLEGIRFPERFEVDDEIRKFMGKHCLYSKIVDNKYLHVFAGSRRKGWLDTSSEGDNFGFAKWVQANAEELIKLGEGRHYGEWYGKGIQRGYELDEKRFALFNVGRWVKKRKLTQLQMDIEDQRPEWQQKLEEKREFCPDCCEVVPVLYEGLFDTNIIDHYITGLKINGSDVVPGFMNPEGIVIYHTASGQLFKKTIKDDEKPKGQND